MPPVSLTPISCCRPVDDAWQKRVIAAAMPIPDSLGSFGPMAYSVEHVHCELPTVAGCELTWKQLRKRNDRLAQSSGYSMFDAFHGGCGGSTAAILAGIFVKAGAELAPAEIDQFEQLTGRTSLGDVRCLLAERIPNVNIWFSCSNCQDFCPLGSKKGTTGSKGGDLFTQQFVGAKAANAQVVIIENVDGVATLHDGAALRTLQQEAAKCGYSRFYSKRVVFSEHGDPEHRARRVIVAFHDSVQLDKPWQFPFATGESTCAGELLEPSYKVPARFWDSRSWYRAATTWARHAVDRIFTLGLQVWQGQAGQPSLSCAGLAPSRSVPYSACVRERRSATVAKLRAMCPLREAFNTWAHVHRTLQLTPAGCIHERRPMPSECLSAKGFPADTPFSSDSDGFRFAGNAVPPSYFKKLFLAVTDVLDRAEVPLVLPRKPDEYITYCQEPLHPNDVDITAHTQDGWQTS